MTRRLLQFAAILGFVVGQWFAVVHATQHELSDTGKQTPCEVCLVSHGAAPLPATLALPPAAEKQSTVLPARKPPAPVSRIAFRPPSRGPPQHLV